MKNRTKYLLLKMLVYVALGFGVAFFWHKLRKWCG